MQINKLKIFTMEQKIQNAELTLVSSGGIKPMIQYNGVGRLAIDEKGFRFVEKKRYTHTRNVRISQRTGKGNEDNIFFLPQEGRFRITLFVDTDKCNLKAIQEQVKPLLAEAKKGEYL